MENFYLSQITTKHAGKFLSAEIQKPNPIKTKLLLLKNSWLMRATLFTFVILFFAATNMVQAQTVTTNKTDYVPGDYVTITGSGWQAGETVACVIRHTIFTTHPDQFVNILADGSGNILDATYQIASWDLGETFLLTATGQTSGLHTETTFTNNAPAYDGDGSMVISPLNVCSSSVGNSFTFTFTAPSGKDFNSGSQLSLSIPAGWTAPQSIQSNNPGFISISGTATTKNISSISGAGPWTILVDMFCKGKETVIITYAGGGTKVTAPSISGANTFTTQTKQNGGTLKEISTSPIITVNARPAAAIISSAATICNGSSTMISGTITAIDSWTLILNNSGGTVTGSGSGTWSKSVTPSSTTTYAIASLTDANCTSIAADLTGSETATINSINPGVIAKGATNSGPGCGTLSPNITANTTSATGSGAISYSWQQSIDGGANWSIIAAATSDQYNPPSLNLTTSFKRIAASTLNSVVCSAESTVLTYVVNPLPTVASILPGGTTNVCVGSSLQLSNATSGGVWSSSNNGTASVNSTGLVSGIVAGDVTIYYTVTDGNTCSKAASKTVHVIALPTVSVASVLPTSVCVSGQVTFSATASSGTIKWYDAATGGNEVTVLNPTISATTTLFAEATSPQGCKSAARTAVTATVNSLPVCSIAGPDGPLCPSSTGNIYTAPASTSNYAWSVSGNATIVGNNNLQTVSVSAGTTCNASFTLTLNITDGNGCSSTCQKIVNVADNTKPVVTAPIATLEVECNDAGAAAAITAWLGTASATHNCDASVAVTNDYTGITMSCNNEITVSFNAKDACNNAAVTKTAKIKVIDIQDPTASNPANITLTGCNGTFPAADIEVVTDEADNCGTPVVAFVSDGTPNLVGCTETTLRTYSITDACGNSINVTQNLVRTIDTQAPVIACTPTYTFTAAIGSCTYSSFTPITPSASDNCTSSESLVVSGVRGDALALNAPYPVGSTVITWSTTDACGNTGICITNVTVNTIAVHNETQNTWYCNIQSAIAAANSDDEIDVAAGTYTEAGQIVIDKNLTIVGVNKATTIIKPAQNTENSGEARGWFLVSAGVIFNISNVTLDGSGKLIYHALRFNGSGIVDNCIITQMKYNESGPDYRGTGIINAAAGNVDVKNCEFSQMGRVGVLVNNGGTGIIDHNTFAGKGSGDWLDYGIDVEYGSVVTITDNQISNNSGIASVDFSESAGVSVWDDPGTKVLTLTGNTFTSNTIGLAVAVATGAGDPSLNIGTGNLFVGGEIGVDLQNAGASGSPAIIFVNPTFKNQSKYAIGFQNGISFGSIVDISSVIFQTSGGAPITDNFAKEDLVSHAIDAGNRGLFVWNASNVYVTPASFVAPTIMTPSIQRAIDAASVTWTVNVAAGTYSGNLTVNKSLTIAGDPGDAQPGPGTNVAVIDGGSARGDAFLLGNGVTGVTIKGFEMRNFTSPSLDGIGNGISAWEASTSNITIQDNYFHHLGYNGVLVGNDGAAGDHNNWLIKNNIIENFGYIGFELTNTSNSSIEGNVIHMNTPYIGAIFSSARRSENGLTLKNNKIDGTPSTSFPVIYFYAYDNDMPNPNLNSVLIEGNDITSIGIPKQIYIRNIGTGTVTGVTVTNNSLSSLRTNTPAFVDASCNWWGTANGNTIASLISGNVSYPTWVTTGGDSDPGPGFTPSGLCNGSSVVMTCGEDVTIPACQTQETVNAAYVSFIASTTASGCDGVLTNNAPAAPSICGGFADVTWTYNSICGTSSCTRRFTITVAPAVVLTCPVAANEISCQTQAEIDAKYATWLGTVIASGGCNGVLTNNSTGAPLATGGSKTVIFTYTNSCELSPATCSATFTVAAPKTISGTLRYNNAAQSPMNKITLTITPGGATSTTDDNGNYSFSNLCDGTYSITITDNQKEVGYINSTDAAIANAWGPSGGTIEYVQFLAGDVAENNLHINNIDAIRIQKFFVNGLAFDKDPWVYWKKGVAINTNFDTKPATFPVTISGSSVVGIDLYGMCTGDFNGSFTPTKLKSTSSSLMLTSAGNMAVGASQKFELPLRAGTSMEVGAVSMILRIPSGLVNVQDVLVNGSSVAADWAVNGDELRIGWYSSTPVYATENSSLLTLKLMTTETFTPGQSIDLALAFDPLNELADGNFKVINGVKLEVALVGNLTVGITDHTDNAGLTISNYPNPFSNSTTVAYTLPVDGKVTIIVYNQLQQSVATLVDATQTAGQYSIRMDSKNLNPGIYIAKLRLTSKNVDSFGTVKLSIQK